MKHRTIIALLLAAVCLLGVTWQAAAHGQTEVGDYELEIGFHNEPAYLNQPNGLDLFVTNSKTGDPVNGLEETLQAEIIFGSSSQILPLEARVDTLPGLSEELRQLRRENALLRPDCDILKKAAAFFAKKSQ